MAEHADNRTQIYSGISYSVDVVGIEVPQKFTTLSGIPYTLIDVHNIDWNSSQLSYVAQIKPEKISYFLGGPERTRYANDTIVTDEKEDQKNLPHWYPSGEINLSGEALDVIDYLLSRCIYLDDKVDELEGRMNRKNVVLIFNPDQVKKFGAHLTAEGNIEPNLTVTIRPNETNEAFGTAVYNSDYKNGIRELEIWVYTEQGIVNQAAFEGKPLNASRTYYPQNNTGVIGMNVDDNVYLLENGTPPGIFWKIKFTLSGWDPKLGYDYNVCNVVLQTPPNSEYNASEPRAFDIMIKKAPNNIDYLFINGNRYYYIEPGILTANTTDEFGNYLYYIIQEKDVLYDEANKKYLTDFASYTPEQKDKIRGYVIGNAAISDSARILLANNQEIDIQVYPKYYGVCDIETQYCGSTDANERSWDNQPCIGDVKWTNLGSNIEETDAHLSSLPKIEFGNREYEGFEWTGILKRKVDTDEVYDNVKDSAILKITTTATGFVASNELSFKAVVAGMQLPIVVDERYDKNPDTYEEIKSQKKTGNNDPFTQYKNSREFIDSSVNKDGKTPIWDLRLPIYSHESWETIDQINLNMINNVGSLIFPNTGEHIDTLNKYLNGLPFVYLYYRSLGSVGNDPFLPLVGVYVKNKKGTTTNFINISRYIEIDFEETWRENGGVNNPWKTRIPGLQIENINELTDYELGKILSDFFVTIKDDFKDGQLDTKRMIFINTTVTTNQIYENYIDKSENKSRYEPFKLVLKIPKNSDGSSQAGQDVLYDELKFIAELRITRAMNSNQYNYTGWAKLNEGGYTKPKYLEYNVDYKISDIVCDEGFTAESEHVITTRSSSLFTKPYNAQSTLINGSTLLYYFDVQDSGSGVTRRIHYKLLDAESKICFTSPDIEEDNISTEWKYNDSRGIDFYGLQKSDYWFEEINNTVNIILNKKMISKANDIDVGFRDNYSMTKFIKSTPNHDFFDNILQEMDITPINPLNGGKDYDGLILGLNVEGMFRDVERWQQHNKLYIGDIITGLFDDSDGAGSYQYELNTDGPLSKVYGKNWKSVLTDGDNLKFLKAFVTINLNERPSSFYGIPTDNMQDIIDGGSYFYKDSKNENGEDLTNGDLIKLKTGKSVNDGSDLFIEFSEALYRKITADRTYTPNIYMLVDILFPMTTIYRGLCLRLRITDESGYLVR